MACDVWGAWCSDFLRWDRHDDYRRRDDCFQPFIRLAHEKGWSGSDYSCQRVHDCCGAVWVFRFPFVFAAVSVGGSLWAGRGRGGCCAQQLCGAAFFLSPYELAALLLERWRSGQPLYHELLPDGRVRLEQRLPLCRCCSDDFDSGVIPQPSALEAAPIRRGGRGERGKGAEPAAGRKDQGRAVRFNHVFGYCALEQAAGLWASSYLVQFRGVDTDTAAWSASLFYLGIAAGRFLCGFVAERLGDRRLIRIGILTMIGGVLLIALPVPYDAFTLAGLLIVGLGCAPVYPSVIHSTPANFGKENSQAIIGIQMASAYVGTTFMPPLFGLIAAHIHIGLYPAFLLALAVLMLCMSEKLNRTVAKRQEGEARKETAEQEAENA